MILRKEIDSYKLHLEEIKKYANEHDLLKGKYFARYYINEGEIYNSVVNGETIKFYEFSLRDYSFNFKTFNVAFGIKNNHIDTCTCDCDLFKQNKSCYHIGAVYYNYANYLFDDKYDDSLLYKDFLNRYKSDDTDKNIVKKEVFVEPAFNLQCYSYEGYKRYNTEFKVFIGMNKMYSLLNHSNGFYQVYDNQDGEFKFGKEFTYNPKLNFFSKQTDRLVKEIKIYILNCNNIGPSRALKRMLDFLDSNKIKFKVSDHVIESIIDGSPLNSYILKENDNYVIKFDYDRIYPLTDDYEYVYYNGDVYHLSLQERNVLEDIVDNELEEIKVDKNELNVFSNGLLKIIKNNVIVDESASEDIKINSLSETELYFDIAKDAIKAKVIFDYKNDKVGYFDKNEAVVRDVDKENEVIAKLTSYGFVVDKKSISMNDVNDEVEFIENGLEELANDYKIFTTEKFNNIKIRKKTNVSSSFGIGSDNIFKYDFSLDNINSDELVNIFKNMKAKKKYFRLKNGDILNLEDDNLKELEDLTEEMNFTDEEIINGRGAIQKYRAIYLDSLRQNKFKNVNTNNLFDDFIKNFYEFKDAKLSISKDELKVLRDYQVTGVKWLYNIHKTGFGGILADEMGLGKTIQTIYYIKQILLEDGNAKFLIVVPTSLVYNWKHEFEMYGENIPVSIVSGTKNLRKKLIEENKNVFITSYGQLREDEDLYKDKSYHTMFIDEAQNIKNYVAGITKVVKGIKAGTKFALTGTPLENSPLELWSIFDYIMPGYLSTAEKFRAKYRITDFDDNANMLLDNLNKQIRPFILRRKKMDVTKDLPDKMENNIFVELTDEQKKIYVAELEKVKKEIDDILKQGGEKKAAFLILPLLTKLRQICIDPKIVYPEYTGGSNKIDSLIYVIKENIANGNKILMFTSFKDAMNDVIGHLEKEDIPYYTISGEVSSKERIRRVDEFNERKDTAVFLIMLKAGGTGLNLASASTVIHLDLWWNPQAENQATDRAHRIGQTKTVEVIHIVAKGTIEEKILELQKKKLKLSEKLIDGEIRDKDILSSLSEKDIRELLSNENKD